jgi:hypothetical protein
VKAGQGVITPPLGGGGGAVAFGGDGALNLGTLPPTVLIKPESEKGAVRTGNTRPADRVTKDGRAKLRHLEASNNCKPSASPLDVPVAEVGL